MGPHFNLFEYEFGDDARAGTPSVSLAPPCTLSFVLARTSRSRFPHCRSPWRLADPAHIHWEASKRVLRYPEGTRKLVLTFGGSDDGIIGYTDAN